MVLVLRPRLFRRPVAGAFTAAVALFATALLAPAPVAAQNADATPDATTTTVDLATQRAQAKRNRKQVGGEISSLRASDDQVRDLLASLDSQLATANAALDGATQLLAAAQAEAAAAEAEEAVARARAEELREQVKQMAIDEFVNPHTMGLAIVITSGSLSEARERQTLLGVRTDQREALLRQQRAAVSELQKKHRLARDAAVAAEQAAAKQRDAIAQLEGSRLAHVQLVAEVDQRLEAALSEAAGLDALDAKLAGQIAQQQQELRAEALARQAAAFAAAQQAAALAPTTTTPPRSPSTPVRPTRPATTTTTTIPRVTPPSLYSIEDMDNVGGIYVNKLISAQFGRMLMDAAAAGLTLGGGGFRDSAAQIATRRNNCGTSDYAIYFMPASQCSPPTARPGTSMHEQGMAVDLTCSGTLIRDQSNPCFVWLAANAANYGFFNLPSEPWHWSINGH